MANETQRCFIQKPCQRPTARLNWIVLYLSFLSTWKKKIRQLVIRTVTLTNTTEDGKLFLCYAHKHREKKKISQCWLTKMPCNIDDENKASHNKLQSYWDDFLFNNESPSASRVNTASVFCECQHACVSEEKRGREKKKTSILNENKTSIFNLHWEQAGMQSQKQNGDSKLRLSVACKSHPDQPAAVSLSPTSFWLTGFLKCVDYKYL